MKNVKKRNTIKSIKNTSINILEAFFEVGSKEEKQLLLQTLESTLISINSEDKYQQAISLIVISEKYNLDRQFVYKIFIKSDAHYRYRLWLENYTNFCNPNYLYRKLIEEKDNDILKSRLHFNISNSSNDIEVHFNGIKDKIIDNISQATTSLKIAMAWFTNYDIFEELLKLKERNINIDLIIINDLINNGGYCLDFNELIAKGANLYLSEYPSMMHHKFCIIDNKILINGSYNWTYYAETINEENISIIKEKSVINSFCSEFERLIKMYPRVDKMPDSIPDKPEYDRGAFKHYISRELIIRANVKSGDEQIKLFHQAIKIAPDFPGNEEIKGKYKEQFDIIDSQITVDEITNSIINSKECSEEKKEAEAINHMTAFQEQQPQEVKKEESSKVINKAAVQMKESKDQIITSPTDIVHPQAIINKPVTISQSTNQFYINNNYTNTPVVNYKPLTCDNLILGIDNSGSMENYYKSGLVNDIINNVISISLKYTNKGSVEVWTYNNQPNKLGSFSLSNLSNLRNIQVGGGTTVSSLVNKVQMNLSGKSLIIILTDGDDNTIRNVIENISNKSQSEFWQFIGLGAKFSGFTTVLNVSNASFCSFDNIRSMTERDIIQVMLNNYLNWIKK